MVASVYWDDLNEKYKQKWENSHWRKLTILVLEKKIMILSIFATVSTKISNEKFISKF